MEFSDFSRILYSYIGSGDEYPKFVLELLSLVSSNKDDFFLQSKQSVFRNGYKYVERIF